MAILCSGCGRQLPKIPIGGKFPVLCGSCQKLGAQALYGATPGADDGEDMGTVDQPAPSSPRPHASGAPRPRSDVPATASRPPPSAAPAPLGSTRTMPAPPPGAPRPGASVAPPQAPRPRMSPSAIPSAPPAPRIDRVPRAEPAGEESMMIHTSELEVLSTQDDELVLNTGDFEPVDPGAK